jgi:hypothetical protein
MASRLEAVLFKVAKLSLCLHKCKLHSGIATILVRGTRIYGLISASNSCCSMMEPATMMDNIDLMLGDERTSDDSTSDNDAHQEHAGVDRSCFAQSESDQEGPLYELTVSCPKEAWELPVSGYHPETAPIPVDKRIAFIEQIILNITFLFIGDPKKKEAQRVPWLPRNRSARKPILGALFRGCTLATILKHMPSLKAVQATLKKSLCQTYSLLTQDVFVRTTAAGTSRPKVTATEKEATAEVFKQVLQQKSGAYNATFYYVDAKATLYQKYHKLYQVIFPPPPIP